LGSRWLVAIDHDHLFSQFAMTSGADIARKYALIED
jgi:hypothetical protein